MLLTEEQRELLDELGHSRSGSLRRLLTERDDLDYPAETDCDPDRCPECGRETVLELLSADAISIQAADEDAVDYCLTESAVDRLYVHEK